MTMSVLCTGLCSGLISPHTSIGANQLDEEYEQKGTENIERGTQAVSKLIQSILGVDARGRLKPLAVRSLLPELSAVLLGQPYRSAGWLLTPEGFEQWPRGTTGPVA